MKNKLINLSVFIIAFIVITPFAKAQDREIEFQHENFEQILAQAKKENKLIFMDCWATWCRPCIYMANTAFKDNEAADFFNKNFINAKFDMEKGEGLEIAQKYGVRVYPTLLFINGDGKVVHRSAGGKDAAGIVLLGKHALDPEKRLSHFQDNYEKNKTKGDFVLKYLNALKEAYLPYNEVASSYFEQLSEEDYLKQENWDLIKTFVEDYESNIFKYLVKNRSAFAEKFGEKQVNEKMVEVYFKSQAQFLTRDLNEKMYNDNKTKILAHNNEAAKHAITYTDVYFYQIKNDWENFAEATDKLITKYKFDDHQRINSFAWTAFERISDNELLKKAIKWSEISVKMKADANYYDTLANLHFKVGNKDEAIKFQKKAIEIAKNSGMNTSNFEETLKTFQN